MKKQQSKSSNDPTQNKKRPSIEFSPTLQKPVYIITKNLNGPHILRLIQDLDKQKVPYQMQQQTQTLGFKLDQRFFVIVDNKYGQVTLGPQFGSILMTVVGYPRIGKNKKNKYFEKPSEIINFYEVFKNNRDISVRQKTLIIKEYSDIIMQKTESNSKLKSKIMVRSISKYKSPEKGTNLKNSEINQNKFQKKLYIIQDYSSEVYSKLCDELSRLIKKESVERVKSVDEARKKTLFIANKANIFYLVNERYQRELLEVIFVGEVLVFNSQINTNNLKSAFIDPKIYGITSEKKQIFKMLKAIGFSINQQSQLELSKVLQNSQACTKCSQINPSKSTQKQYFQNFAASQKQQALLPEISKIQGAQSFVSENLKKQNDLNTSNVSQNSTKSKKAKRVNKKKQKSINEPVVESEYLAGKKENEPPKAQKYQRYLNRKKTLKTEQKQSTAKEKKILKFTNLPEDQSKIRRIKSIFRIEPTQVWIGLESNATMTQQEYFPEEPKVVKSFRMHSQNHQSNRISRISSKSSAVSHYLKDNKDIDAVFYRQFIQKFIHMAELIKDNPSLFFSQPQKPHIFQPFFNMTEFDRYAKRIKRKLKEAGHSCHEFRFLVFITQDQLSAFEKYCFEKNKSYQEDFEMESIMKTSNISATFTTPTIPKLTICCFIGSKSKVQQKVLSFGIIKLLQFGFPSVAQFSNSQKPLQLIRLKLIQNNVIEHRDCEDS